MSTNGRNRASREFPIVGIEHTSEYSGGVWEDEYPSKTYDRDAVMKEVDERIREALYSQSVNRNFLPNTFDPRNLVGWGSDRSIAPASTLHLDGSSAGTRTLNITTGADLDTTHYSGTFVSNGRPIVCLWQCTILVPANHSVRFWVNFNGSDVGGRLCWCEGGSITAETVSGFSVIPAPNPGSYTLKVRFAASTNGNTLYDDYTVGSGDSNITHLYAYEIL